MHLTAFVCFCAALCTSSLKSGGPLDDVDLPVQHGQFIYLTQGPAAPPKWLCEVGERPDSQVIYASFKEKLGSTLCKGIEHTIFLPGSSWTSGRNSLYAYASKLQQERGLRAEYLVFTDDDVEIYAENETADARSLFHTALSNVQPAVATVGCRQYNPTKEAQNRCGSNAPCAPDIDASFNAFHATAAPILLPYDEHFDKDDWWSSQAILIELMLASMPEHVVQFNRFFLKNTGHSEYPTDAKYMSKWGDDFTPVAKHLRKRVNACLRDRIGLVPIGAGAGCHRCQKTSACEASDACVPSGGSPAAPINYMDVVKCKPYMA